MYIVLKHLLLRICRLTLHCVNCTGAPHDLKDRLTQASQCVGPENRTSWMAYLNRTKLHRAIDCQSFSNTSWNNNDAYISRNSTDTCTRSPESDLALRAATWSAIQHRAASTGASTTTSNGREVPWIMCLVLDVELDLMPGIPVFRAPSWTPGAWSWARGQNPLGTISVHFLERCNLRVLPTKRASWPILHVVLAFVVTIHVRTSPSTYAGGARMTVVTLTLSNS